MAYVALCLAPQGWFLMILNKKYRIVNISYVLCQAMHVLSLSRASTAQ